MVFRVNGANGAISGSLDGGAVARNPCASWAFLSGYVTTVRRMSVLLTYVGTGDRDVLRQVVVPIISSDYCRAMSYTYDIRLTDNMICAGYRQGGKDACSGDSGGPLVCRQGGRWWQHGVVSWGKPGVCGLPNEPGVYSSVVKYLPWIESKTGSQYMCMFRT